MNYEPHEIAQADQTLAGVTHQLGRLVDTIADPHPNVPNVDGLAGLLFVTLGPADLAVTLAVAVHQLAQRDQTPTPGCERSGEGILSDTGPSIQCSRCGGVTDPTHTCLREGNTVSDTPAPAKAMTCP